MKRLKIISIVIGGLIVIGFIASVVMTNALNNRITAAQESGRQEGSAQGYVVGYQDGTIVGYQEGSEVGYQEGSTAGYEKGREEGYNYGYEAGFDQGVGTGYPLRNPTYSEMQQILAQEETTSAGEINNDAEAKGIRAAYVCVKIAAGREYTILGFETVDKGLILIDPQWPTGPKEVRLEIGKRYSQLVGYLTPAYDDTITEIIIIW